MLEKIIDTPGFNAVVKGRHGYIVFNKNDTYVGRSIEKYGEYSEAEVELFKQICSQGDIVVEVGANIGTHTLPLSQIVGEKGRVYAFEPQRIVFQTLCANLSINSIQNVECYQMGLSSENGFALIPDVNYNTKNNLGDVRLKEMDYKLSAYKVPTAKLDDFLKLSRLNFLKIDVQGMEYQVIRGAKRLIKKYQSVMYVENDDPKKSKELIEFIWSLDYKIFWHCPFFFNDQNYAGDSENIYPNMVSLNMFCISKSREIEITGLEEIVDSEFHPVKLR
jgi:FkbM family methyltransferase